ncbi:MAG: primosomal protein N', partial [Lachnospiraceae bacterium]|nr:primosomal protein N' [Lachnospiraceae bacterium]
LMHYPPAGCMMSIRVTSDEEAAAEDFACELAAEIRVRFAREEPTVIGPSDARVAKVQDVYRKMIYVKHEERQVLLDIRAICLDGPDCAVQVDLL